MNNKQKGWVKLHRQLRDKAFYTKDSEKVHLWIHLLLRANHAPREEMFSGKPINVKSGQFTTGRKQLSFETGISESKIERILSNFEKIEQQIEQQKSSSNRLISILRWGDYQESEQQIEQQVNNDRTTSEQQVNTLEECKEEKEIPKPTVKDFYMSELENNKNKRLTDLYSKLIDALYGANISEKSLSGVLKLRDQLTYKQFEALYDKSNEKGKKIMPMIIDLENNSNYRKGRKSLYLILNSWLNN